MNHRLPVFLIFILLFSCQAPTTPDEVSHGMSSERLQAYEQFLQKEVDEGRLAGIVSRIERNGVLAHDFAVGYSDILSKDALRTEDIFFIQSMTKPIITTAFMMLYEEGHFFLDDPVSMYLPKFKNRSVALEFEKGTESATEPANKEITISHLLTHSAGLSHGLFGYGLDNDYAAYMYGETHQTVEDRVNRMLDLPLIGHPGEQWYYSAAPDVLSVLIAQFSGISTEEFLQTRLFDPLGMSDTGYNLPETKHERVMRVHRLDSSGTLVSVESGSLGGNQKSGNTIHSGVNGLFSSAKDYLRFCQMILNQGELNGKRYLSRKTIELMSENHIGDLYPWGDGFGFGYGFKVLEDLSDTKALGSKGSLAWSGAYSTYFFIDPKENLSAVFMTQLDPFSNYYERKFFQMVYAAIDN